MRFGVGFFYMLAGSMLAADPAGFALWKANELAQHDQALAGKLQPDHSARETLGEYANHRVRLIYRVGESEPELHDKIVDIWVVQSGEGTLVLGGELLDRKASAGDGEWRGSRIRGGERHPIRAGDIVRIPAGMPHGVIVPEGKHITYVNMRLNAAEAGR